MIPQVYFRYDTNFMDEYEICKHYFPTVYTRTSLNPNLDPIVICRYSAVPFNKELEMDLHNLGLRPINSSLETSKIMDFSWYEYIEESTPKTWFRFEDVPKDIPLVIKGKTNSRKFEWNTKMFAKDKKAASSFISDLYNDPLIGPQGLVFREYIPLVTFEIGINDMPMTNEWRCFFYKGKLIDYGYYWSCLDDMDKVDQVNFEKSGLLLACEVSKTIAENIANFYVIDVAQKQDGGWIVIEINDGQMSGLATIPIDRFYQNLQKGLK